MNRQTQIEGWSREIQIWGRGRRPGPGTGKHKYPTLQTSIAKTRENHSERLIGHMESQILFL